MKRLQKSVLDSFALLSFLFQERGGETVLHLLEWARDHGERHLMSAVNWAEVCYTISRKARRITKSDMNKLLLNLPLDIIAVDRELAEQASLFKVQGGISLGDCCAAALAKRYDLPLYTGDPEFALVESEVRVVWL